ncbi:aquaporin-4-like isoform X1 [Lingula anatina]|uniref:Aquaporin-4-like isoform X1 n=1 Tax=Lingula anatina TaxID=7574 RepID=A0A1S3H543_LINAN|nr:aquaporin-4-like isoform X1 [Lingula anatina]|eukprot:XP_013380581.1 aquaporin-4-like isoform X1 [Lingula anatina]
MDGVLLPAKFRQGGGKQPKTPRPHPQVAAKFTEVKKELGNIEFWRAVISECIATLLYVLLGCASTLRWDVYAQNATSDVSSGHVNNDAGTTEATSQWTHETLAANSSHADADFYIVRVAFCFGLAYTTLQVCFGHISGGHLNPAITIATVVTSKISVVRGIGYVLAQCGGSIAGAALLYGLSSTAVRGHMGVTKLAAGLTLEQGLGMEIVTSFLLVFTLFSASESSRSDSLSSSVAMGAVVTMMHLATVQFTGCGINPARSLGPSFITNYWENHWIYWLGPCLGGIVAGILYKYIFDPRKTAPRRSSGVQESQDSDDGTFNYKRCKFRDSNSSKKSPKFSSRSGSNLKSSPSRASTLAYKQPYVAQGADNRAYNVDTDVYDYEKAFEHIPLDYSTPVSRSQEMKLFDVASGGFSGSKF